MARTENGEWTWGVLGEVKGLAALTNKSSNPNWVELWEKKMNERSVEYVPELSFLATSLNRSRARLEDATRYLRSTPRNTRCRFGIADTHYLPLLPTYLTRVYATIYRVW